MEICTEEYTFSQKIKLGEMWYRKKKTDQNTQIRLIKTNQFLISVEPEAEAEQERLWLPGAPQLPSHSVWQSGNILGAIFTCVTLIRPACEMYMYFFKGWYTCS